MLISRYVESSSGSVSGGGMMTDVDGDVTRWRHAVKRAPVDSRRRLDGPAGVAGDDNQSRTAVTGAWLSRRLVTSSYKTASADHIDYSSAETTTTRGRHTP